MKLMPLVILLLLPTVPLGAHEGHGAISILTGTLTNVEKDRLEIKTLDLTFGSRVESTVTK